MVSRWCVVSALLASCAHKNTACPCNRTHRADGCVPAADSDPDQAGPESHGQGRGAGQVDCAYASFIHSLHAPPAKCFWRSKVLLAQATRILQPCRRVLNCPCFLFPFVICFLRVASTTYRPRHDHALHHPRCTLPAPPRPLTLPPPLLPRPRARAIHR